MDAKFLGRVTSALRVGGYEATREAAMAAFAKSWAANEQIFGPNEQNPGAGSMRLSGIGPKV
jgi:hypothetical protein